MTRRTAWIVGATGLVGRATTQVMLADDSFAKVVAWVRRPTALRHARLVERVIDFERLEAGFTLDDESALARGSARSDSERPDVAVCALGTTIKLAGSKERFRRVDHDYVLAFARASKQAGARCFAVVTAMGADPSSAIFYNLVKGEVEQDLTSLAFESLVIARPSLLLGERAETRLGERLMAPLSRFLPARYRGIEAETVARALHKLVREPVVGRRLVLSDALQTLGALG